MSTDLHERSDALLEASNLTGTQLLFWMGERLHGGAPLYDMILAFEIRGEIDPELFRRAFRSVVERSDTLRSVVIEVDGRPEWRVLPEIDEGLVVEDFSLAPDPDALLRAWIEEHRALGVKTDERLFRTALLRVSGDRWVWYLDQHHFATDGWSAAVLYRAVADAYRLAREGRLADAAPLPAYADYARFEREWRESPSGRRAREYWKAKEDALGDPVEPGRPRGARLALSGAMRRSTRSRRLALSLGAERSARLRDAAAAVGPRALTPHLALFHAFATLLYAWLHRTTGRTSIAAGAPAHNRASAAFKNTIGVFIEMLPLQVEIAPGETFRSLAVKVAAETASFLRHAGPGMASARAQARLDVVLNYINAGFPDFDGCPVRVDWIHSGHGDALHSLRLQIHDFEGSGNFLLHFDLHRDDFDADESQAVLDGFSRTIDAFLDDPDLEIASVDLIGDRGRRWLVDELNATEKALPEDRTVIDLFRESVARDPAAVAVVDGVRELTYRELAALSTRIASVLRERLQARPGVHIAVALPRSTELVAAVLGVLETGAAWVPLDPEHPKTRLEFQLTDSAAAGVVTDRATRALLPADVAAIEIESVADDELEPSAVPRPLASDLAYVMYTSGSTGAPKGVLIEHRGLLNYVLWAADTYLGSERLDFPLYSSVAFDLTVTSIFVPLARGSRIVVYRESSRAGALAVIDVFRDDRVDIVKLTPSHLALVREAGIVPSRIRKLILGGEDLETDLARQVTERLGGGVEIWNEYGPTETVVGATIHRYDVEKDVDPSVPIGRPIANTRIYVLDREHRPVPIGASGEIWIGGAGVARGYLCRPDLSAERFIPSPFRAGERLYATGDRGRFRADGILEYLGRDDRQVKVGGVRVELAEVEAVIREHEDVAACAVDVFRPRGGTVRRCIRCGIGTDHPEVVLDPEEVCGLCRAWESHHAEARRYFKTMDDLRRILDEARGARGGDHDCLVLLSGGKDSTYMLYQIARMGYRALAYTLDNGYISEGAKENIRRVTKELGIEHIFGSTPAMGTIFADSLRRHANVCNGCFKTLYTLSLRVARERGIRCIVTGLSRGQFFETRLGDLFREGVFDPERIDRAILDARRIYHRMPDAVTENLAGDLFAGERIFDEVRFVDFYRYSDATLEEMYAFLDREAPWIRPRDTGRSTNCLVNDVGIWVHKRERGFHNYAYPYSWDVRMGHKKRDEALAELDDEIDEERVRRLLDEIGYEPRERAALPGEERLVAFVVLRRPLASGDLERHIASRLPREVAPARFVELDRLPLTTNGKVDRAALAARLELVERGGSGGAIPEGPVETELARIWEDVLGVEDIRADDDFFALGGSSLRAVHLVSRIHRAWGVALPLDAAFDSPTLRALAARIERRLIDEIESLSEDDARRLVEGDIDLGGAS